MNATDLINICMTRLAAEGLTATLADNEDGQQTIRVPALEEADGELSRRKVYEFISSRLGGQRLKGMLLRHLIDDRAITDIYCYHPLFLVEGDVPTGEHIVTWASPMELEDFDWSGLIEGDDVAWCDGWDVVGYASEIPNRLPFLATLLSYELVDLPPVKPLSRTEIIERIKTKQRRYMYRRHDTEETLTLVVDASGQLVITSSNGGSPIAVTDDHFDASGCLVYDGHTILHRCDFD